MLPAIRTARDTFNVGIQGLEALGVQKSSFSLVLCDLPLRALLADNVVGYLRATVENTATTPALIQSEGPLHELEHLLFNGSRKFREK